MANCSPDYLVSVGLPIGTFLLGFLASRFTLSKKEQLDQRQRFFENERKLSESQQQAYGELQSSLKAYVDAPEPSIDHFLAISSSGDNYFRRLKEVAEAALSGDVREAVIRDNFLPILEEAVNKTLPSYYAALKQIAEKKGFDYTGELRRSNYEQIYAAVEKFGSRS